MPDLAPCPFCGETETLRFVLMQVHCGVCGAAGPIDVSDAQAAANWNRRPTDALTARQPPMAPDRSCPRCGLYLSARGCTVERCANPEGAAELERLASQTPAEAMAVEAMRADLVDALAHEMPARLARAAVYGPSDEDE